MNMSLQLSLKLPQFCCLRRHCFGRDPGLSLLVANMNNTSFLHQLFGLIVSLVESSLGVLAPPGEIAVFLPAPVALPALIARAVLMLGLLGKTHGRRAHPSGWSPENRSQASAGESGAVGLSLGPTSWQLGPFLVLEFVSRLPEPGKVRGEGDDRG